MGIKWLYILLSISNSNCTAWVNNYIWISVKGKRSFSQRGKFHQALWQFSGLLRFSIPVGEKEMPNKKIVVQSRQKPLTRRVFGLAAARLKIKTLCTEVNPIGS